MIIGITGKAQSGKDTVCKIIQLIDLYSGTDSIKEEFVLNYLNHPICRTTEKWEKHAFADKLKECAAIILGVDRAYFEDNLFKKQFTSIPLSNKEGEPMTNREFLQYFGTEVGRNIDKDLWVKSLINEYTLRLSSNPYIGLDNDGNAIYAYDSIFWIVPDVRFPNEADAIKKIGGTIIKINREGSGAGNHISEQLIDQIPFDYEINNNGSMKELITKVIDVYEDILNK